MPILSPTTSMETLGNAGFRVGYMKCVANAYFSSYGCVYAIAYTSLNQVKEHVYKQNCVLMYNNRMAMHIRNCVYITKSSKNMFMRNYVWVYNNSKIRNLHRRIG